MFLWKVFSFVLILLMERKGLDQIGKYRNYNCPSPPPIRLKSGEQDIVVSSLQTPCMSGKVRLVGPVDRGLSECPENIDLGNSPAF